MPLDKAEKCTLLSKENFPENTENGFFEAMKRYGFYKLGLKLFQARFEALAELRDLIEKG